MGICCRSAAALPVLLAACMRLESPLTVEQAVLVLPAGGAPAAVYFTVHNRGKNLVSVTGVEIPGGPAATLQSVTAHRMPAISAARGPMTLMSPISGVDLSPGSTVRFTPGGYTVTLASAPATWKPGDRVAFAVVSSGAWRREAWAFVVRYTQLDSALGLAAADAAQADSATQVREGAMLYRGNGCAQCHGVRGDGEGPLAPTLAPPPRNFRGADAFRNGRDLESLAQTLATGIPGGGAMPLYAHLTRVERLALARFLLALPSMSSAGVDSALSTAKE